LAEVTDNEDKNENDRPKSKLTATNSKHSSDNKAIVKGYKPIEINFFHDLNDHDGLPRMRVKAKVLGIHFTGILHCDAYSTVKAKSAAILRKHNHPDKAPNEQMFLDTIGPFKIGVKQRGRFSNLFLFRLIDKYSSKRLFGFGSEKSDIIRMFKDVHHVCNGKNFLPIKNVTMDNGGENLAIATFCRHNNTGSNLLHPIHQN